MPHGGDLVGYLLEECQLTYAGSQFVHSNMSSHLVAAVWAAALQRADVDSLSGSGDRVRSAAGSTAQPGPSS